MNWLNFTALLLIVGLLSIGILFLVAGREYPIVVLAGIALVAVGVYLSGLLMAKNLLDIIKKK